VRSDFHANSTLSIVHERRSGEIQVMTSRATKQEAAAPAASKEVVTEDKPETGLGAVGWEGSSRR